MSTKYDSPQQNARIILATMFPDPNVRIKQQSMLDSLVESPAIQALIKQFRHDLRKLAKECLEPPRPPSIPEDAPKVMPAEGWGSPSDEEASVPVGGGPGDDPASEQAERDDQDAADPEATLDSGAGPSNGVNSQSSPLQPGDIPTTPAQESAPKEAVIKTLALSIPNGRTGQPYEADLAALCPELGDCAELSLDEGGDIGLALESPARLTGLPEKTGSHRLRVSGHDEDGTQVVETTLKIAVIPNSRDLWKTLPADQDAPYAKPEGDTDRRAAQPGWQLTVGSQRGRSHAHKGTHRDDHGIVAHTESGWNLLVIGDGAGSCEFSREGSRLATTHTLEALRQFLGKDGGNLEEALIGWWHSHDRSTLPQSVIAPLSKTVIPSVHAGYKAIAKEADASGHPVKAFATTLLLAAHKPVDDGHLIVSFGIGDGAIAVLAEPNHAKLMNAADSGEHAGQTRFLDQALFQDANDLYQRVQVQVLPTLEALVLATDGITDPKFGSDNDMHNGEPWWSLFEEVKPCLPITTQTGSEDPLLEYLDFFIERHHDDRTIAVLHRIPVDTATTEVVPAAGGDHE